MGTKKLTLKKQLMAAVAMVLVALLAIGTATFAWFANNNSVKADGMQLKVKAPGSFLLISETNTTATTIQNENANQVTFTDANATLSPVAPKATVTGAANARNCANWYYTQAGSPTLSTKDTNAEETELENFTGYVIKKEVYVTVAKDSANVKDLTVKPTIQDKDGKALSEDFVRVMVTSSEYNSTTSLFDRDVAQVVLGKGDSGTVYTTKLYTDNIDDETVVKLDIFIYIDGTLDDVYSSNYSNLLDTNITLQFDATEVPTT